MQIKSSRLLRLLPGIHGMTLTPNLIYLLPERMNDAALIEHELVHAEQMRKFGTFTFWRRYLLDREFRLEMELEGYGKQLTLQPWRLDDFAEALAKRYFLGITAAQARALLLADSSLKGPP